MNRWRFEYFNRIIAVIEVSYKLIKVVSSSGQGQESGTLPDMSSNLIAIQNKSSLK